MRKALGLQISFEGLLVFSSVFLTSLGSFYFYSIGLYVFQLAGLLLAMVLCKKWPIPLASTPLFVLAIFFFGVYAYDAILLIVGVNTVTGGRLFLPILFCLCYWFTCAAFLSPKKFIQGVKIVIIIHCVIFLVQFFVFLFFGYFIDFLEPVTGESQRALGGNYEISMLSNFIRATGLYNEPGTYSTYMMLLLVFVKDLEQITHLRSMGRFVELLVLVTVMLSFSNFGFVFVGLYLFFEFVVKAKSGMQADRLSVRALTTIFLVAGVAFCGVIFYQYFQQRFLFSGDEAGVEFRLFGLMNVLGDVNWIELILGRGFSAPTETYNGTPLPIQDIGFWFSVFYYAGIIGALILGWCLTSSLHGSLRNFRANPYFCCLLILVLLCKLGFTNPIILIFLIYASLRGIAIKKYLRLQLMGASPRLAFRNP